MLRGLKALLIGTNLSARSRLSSKFGNSPFYAFIFWVWGLMSVDFYEFELYLVGIGLVVSSTLLVLLTFYWFDFLYIFFLSSFVFVLVCCIRTGLIDWLGVCSHTHTQHCVYFINSFWINQSNMSYLFICLYFFICLPILWFIFIWILFIIISTLREELSFNLILSWCYRTVLLLPWAMTT